MKIEFPFHIGISRDKLDAVDGAANLSSDAIDKLRLEMFGRALANAVLNAKGQGLELVRLIEIKGTITVGDDPREK